MQTPRCPVIWACALTAKARSLFVTDADPLDAVLLPDRLGDGVEGVSDDAPDWVTPWSASAVTMDSATVGTAPT